MVQATAPHAKGTLKLMPYTNRVAILNTKDKNYKKPSCLLDLGIVSGDDSKRVCLMAPNSDDLAVPYFFVKVVREEAAATMRVVSCVGQSLSPNCVIATLKVPFMTNTCAVKTGDELRVFVPAEDSDGECGEIDDRKRASDADDATAPSAKKGKKGDEKGGGKGRKKGRGRTTS